MEYHDRKKSKTNSEKNARKILTFLEKSKGHFFKNRPVARKNLGMNYAEINAGTKILVKQGILVKYGSGCYKIHQEK